MNWGLASLTVAIKQAGSSKAGCKERCKTPSRPFRVALGTENKEEPKRNEVEICVKGNCQYKHVLWAVMNAVTIRFRNQ